MKRLFFDSMKLAEDIFPSQRIDLDVVDKLTKEQYGQYEIFKNFFDEIEVAKK